MRLHRGVSSHGVGRSYGGRAFAASRKFDLLPSPGFEATARIVEKHVREVKRRWWNSHKEGPLTDCGYMMGKVIYMRVTGVLYAPYVIDAI